MKRKNKIFAVALAVRKLLLPKSSFICVTPPRIEHQASGPLAEQRAGVYPAPNFPVFFKSAAEEMPPPTLPIAVNFAMMRH